MTADGKYELSDLIAIKQAIADGAREVWYGDKRVVYGSIQDLITTKNMIERELAPPHLRSGRRQGVFYSS